MSISLHLPLLNQAIIALRCLMKLLKFPTNPELLPPPCLSKHGLGHPSYQQSPADLGSILRCTRLATMERRFRRLGHWWANRLMLTKRSQKAWRKRVQRMWVVLLSHFSFLIVFAYLESGAGPLATRTGRVCAGVIASRRPRRICRPWTVPLWVVVCNRRTQLSSSLSWLLNTRAVLRGLYERSSRVFSVS